MSESSLHRLIGVLVGPRKTFQSLVRDPRWVAAMFAIMLAGLALALAILARLDAVAIMRSSAEQAGRSYTAEELALAATVYKVWFAGGIVLGVPLSLFLVAQLFVVISKLSYGGVRYREARERRAVSRALVFHAFMPFGIAALLSAVAAYGREALTLSFLQRGTLLPSSLAALAPADAPLPLVCFLDGFDLFFLWIAALTVIGFREAGLMPTRWVVGLVITLWGLWVLGRVALGAMSSVAAA